MSKSFFKKFAGATTVAISLLVGSARAQTVVFTIMERKKKNLLKAVGLATAITLGGCDCGDSNPVSSDDKKGDYPAVTWTQFDPVGDIRNRNKFFDCWNDAFLNETDGLFYKYEEKYLAAGFSDPRENGTRPDRKIDTYAASDLMAEMHRDVFDGLKKCVDETEIPLIFRYYEMEGYPVTFNGPTLILEPNEKIKVYENNTLSKKPNNPNPMDFMMPRDAMRRFVESRERERER